MRALSEILLSPVPFLARHALLTYRALAKGDSRKLRAFAQPAGFAAKAFTVLAGAFGFGLLLGLWGAREPDWLAILYMAIAAYLDACLALTFWFVSGRLKEGRG